MKKILIFLFIAVSFVATACASGNLDSSIASDELSSSTNANQTKGSVTKVKIFVNEKTLYATFDDNATSRAIIAQMPMTLKMLDLYGDEMCYRYPNELPIDDVKSYVHKKGEIFYWPPRHSFVIRYVATTEELEIQHVGQIDSGVEIFNGIGDVDVKFEVVADTSR